MKQNNVKIAITGGIGSGKTTVAKILKQNGQKILSCDEIYSELLKGKELPEKIAASFGRNILLPDGSLDRKKLSSIVFNDREKLETLNNITHPEIISEIFQRAKKEQGLVFCEVPLLFECDIQDKFDGVVVVLRSLSKRISSVAARDGVSEENVKKRILNQHNYENNDFSQYYVIHNDANIDKLGQETKNTLAKIKADFGI